MNRLFFWFFHLFGFESKEMKTSYFLFNKEVEIGLLGLIHFIGTAAFILVTIAGIFLNLSLQEILIRVGLVGSSIFILLIRRRWLLIYKIFVTIIAAGFIFYIMVYVTGIYKSSNDKSNFLTGNAIGMFEIIVVLSFKALWFRVLSFIALTMLKICLLYHDILNQPRIFAQFFVCVLLVFLFIVHDDILDRRNFGLIYKTREKIQKFQDLLSNDLPSSVMIMSSDFSSILYSNKFFQQKFTPVESAGNVTTIIHELLCKMILQVEEKEIQSIRFYERTSLLDYLMQISKENLELSEQEGHRTLYASHKDEEGYEFYYEVRLRKIFWDGKHSYAIVMNDITDKQLVHALKIADTQKDIVIATVSHELRTPINGIVGLLEMASELSDDKTLLGYLDNCKSCSKLLLYLVNAILDLSQLRNNSLKIVKNTFQLTEMLEELRSLYLFQSLQKGIDFIIEKDPSITEKVYTDKYRLIEILINLLGNAMKFTFKGSVKLKISKSDQRRDYLVFSVEDTGLGIMEKDKPKLFKMFGKIDQTNKNINTHGAGLGLTIANELVKALNDNDKQEKITFESEFNKGSRFWFEVNIAKPIDEASSLILNNNIEVNVYSKKFESKDLLEFSDPSNAPFLKFGKMEGQDNFVCENNPFLPVSKEMEDFFIQKKNFAKAKKRVLLIDDNPLNLMAASFILEKLHLSVMKAFNGQEGIKLLDESVKKRQKFSLVLTDIQMPIMDGLEMSEKIKEKIQKKELYPIPIIALTAKKLEEPEITKYKEFGITHTLEKPLVRSKIEKVINDLLSENLDGENETTEN